MDKDRPMPRSARPLRGRRTHADARPPHRPWRAARRGTTLIELLLTLSVLAVLLTLAALPWRALAARQAVRLASLQVRQAFAEARGLALRHGGAAVELDQATAAVTVRVRDSLVRARPLGALHQVSLRSSTAGMRFDQWGRGRGIANGTIIVARGGAADTLVVSRLGRVRE
jgi:prepilin-type N-terminal cleavage/methylation domain-containing protein